MKNLRARGFLSSSVSCAATAAHTRTGSSNPIEQIVLLRGEHLSHTALPENLQRVSEKRCRLIARAERRKAGTMAVVVQYGMVKLSSLREWQYLWLNSQPQPR
jgi:hypothetical protein